MLTGRGCGCVAASSETLGAMRIYRPMYRKTLYVGVAGRKMYVAMKEPGLAFDGSLGFQGVQMTGDCMWSHSELLSQLPHRGGTAVFLQVPFDGTQDFGLLGTQPGPIHASRYLFSIPARRQIGKITSLR